uniref:Synapse-associated protein n=1 Tax=Rhizophora mucronata TaxID=61149 RepID=A0A2P2J9Z6_RHIMU
MDFFRSVFTVESESQRSESETKSKLPLNQEHSELPDPSSRSLPKPENPNPSPSSDGGRSLGGLIKTLTTKSESVFETYRRDLKEFGAGLKKEIKVAQGSLENAGHAIDEIGSSVLKGTAQIISHGKDAILSLDQETDSFENNKERNITSQQSLDSKRYSRFDAQVRAIQGDASTYCDDPEDLDDYRKWKSEFALEEKREETECLLQENVAMASLYERVVPDSVDEETFWCRYFYRVYKLKQTEELRAKLVRRANSREDEEEDLSWDVEEDDEEDVVEEEDDNDIGRKGNEKLGSKEDSAGSRKHGVEETSEIKKMDNEESEQKGKSFDNKKSTEDSEQTVSVKEKEISVEEMKSKEEKTTSEGDNVASKKADLDISKGETVTMSDEKASSEGKGDNGESCKDSEFSVVSSHPSMPEEEDLGWDEIEDLSSIDDKKTDHSGSANKADLRKRLSAAEEEEDLSWDIEDDDEPAKA